MRAAEVMTQIPNCCTPSSTARMAAALLKQFKFGALAVVDDYSCRKLVGIVTDRDLCIEALAGSQEPDAVLVADCMTRDPVSCQPETDVQDILALMAAHRVRRIPIVDQNLCVVGMVTLTDLVHRQVLPPQDLCAALARIVAPAKQVVRARDAAAGKE